MDAPPADGKILTFYSYKGGVGRSMALANVAVLLGSMGKRVLIVDWDLEAPGIEHYFQSYLVRRKDGPPPGIVELMTDGIAGTLDWRACLTRVAIAGAELHIIGAGRKDDGYSKRLAAISWKDLFAADLGRFLERLREEWTAAYDFVLVDSRTGITDIGGICTIHLPDAVIALFTANEQSLVGVAQSLRSACVEHSTLPVDRAKLIIIPVPARDESQSEHEKSKQWLARFATELDDLYRDWLPKTVTPAQALEILRIPYKAYWSFGEPLPVVEDGIRSPTSIGYAYALLASLIETGFDWTAMTAGRFSLPAPAPILIGSSTGSFAAIAPTIVPAPSAPARTPRWLLGLGAAIAAIAISLFVVLRPGGDGKPSVGSGRDVDAGKVASPEERKRDALLEAARATKDPLQRALIVREIPAQVFPIGEAKRLLEGLRLPEAVFGGDLVDARFDHHGERVLLSTPAALRIRAADGRGVPLDLEIAAPLNVATFSPDDNHLIIADGAGVTIRDAATGARTGGIQYFDTNKATFVTSADGQDGAHTYVLAGGSGATGTKHAIFSINAPAGTVARWWDSKFPVLAIGYHDGRLFGLVSNGAVAAMAKPTPSNVAPDAVSDVLKGQSQLGVIGGGRAALARGKEVFAWPIDARRGTSATITASQPPTWTPGALAVNDQYVAAAVDGTIVVVGPDGQPTTYRISQAQPGFLALGGDWLLTSSDTGAIDLWHMAGDRTYVNLMPAGGQPIASASFSADAKRVLAILRDGTVRVWTVGTDGVIDNLDTADAMLKALHDATSACLTTDERVDLLKEPAAEAAGAYTDCVAAARGAKGAAPVPPITP